MIAGPATWGFLGLFAGPWKMVIIAAVVTLFYGRAIRPSLERFLGVRLQTARSVPIPSESTRRWTFGDRTYFLLVVVSATAVATWIIAKLTISTSVHSSL